LVQKTVDYLRGLLLHSGAFVQNGLDCLNVRLKSFAPEGIEVINRFVHQVHFGVNVNYRDLKLM
jgi:hypothetical protein